MIAIARDDTLARHASECQFHFMSSGPSLLGRAVAAVLLMIGFYLLALAIVGVLVAIPVAEIRYGERLDIRLAGFCLVGAFAILRGIVPRRDRFDAPGPALTATEQPRLFATLEALARATAQSMPTDVYLVPDVNAFVTKRGGIMGFGSRRVMGLGLPLLQRLSVDEVRAVIAHEFGHYHGGDTALGPWVYTTRAAIGRTLQSLSRHSATLMKPFSLYGMGFLRITHAISRRQEYAADALAARIVGAAPLATGLKSIHGVAAAFAPYWMSEVAPVLEHGYRPPIGAGFSQFLARPAIASQVDAAIAHELESGKVDPYDTHPPLRERIAALGEEAAAAKPNDGPRAITLLENEDAAEAQLLSFLLRRKRGTPLQSIQWSDAGPRVWATIWRNKARVASDRLRGLTPAQLPALASDLAGAAVRFGFSPDRQIADARGGSANALELLCCAVAVLLLDRGWSVSALPGETPTFTREGRSLTPFSDLGRIAQGKLAASDWEATWQEIGLLNEDLGALPMRDAQSRVMQLTTPANAPAPKRHFR
jgi:Zn-dependent protease with chaperone function